VSRRLKRVNGIVVGTSMTGDAAHLMSVSHHVANLFAPDDVTDLLRSSG
jgi:hypothetical protein